MSAPGSPTHARRESPIVHQNHRVEYTSSYSDHFNGMARPSSAPPSTTPRRQLQYDSPLKNNNNNNNNNNSNSYNTNNNNYNRTSSYNSSNNGGTLLAPMPLDSSLSPSTPRYNSSSLSLSPSTPRRHSSSLFPAQSTTTYNNTTPSTNYNNSNNNNSTSYSSTYNSSLSPTSPSSPRYDEISGAATSRYAKYNWNKTRNPLVDGDEQKSPSGRKHVPSYFENLEKFDEDTKRLARKSRPEPTPFMIDPTRAGIPTLIQKIRTHEEDIYYQKRPSTAPESPMTREDIPGAGATPKQYSRRPCQIEKFNTRRNPLIDSGDVEPIRRQIIGFNKESEAEVQFARKTILVPPSLQNVTRTNDYFVPGEMPAPDPIRLRINHPDDSDIFNHSHPLVAPNVPQLMGAVEREQAQKRQEVALDQAYKQQVSFYNDEIKKFKAKAKLKSGAL